VSTEAALPIVHAATKKQRKFARTTAVYSPQWQAI